MWLCVVWTGEGRYARSGSFGNRVDVVRQVDDGKSSVVKKRLKRQVGERLRGRES